jgi:hypothetical protein
MDGRLRVAAARAAVMAAGKSESKGLTRRAVLGSFCATCLASAAPSDVMSLVKPMEARYGVAFSPYNPFVRLSIWPAISPDGRAMCWQACCSAAQKGDYRARSLQVRTEDGGVRQVFREGQAFLAVFAISDGAGIVVARTSSLMPSGRRRLVALDLRLGGAEDHDLAASLHVEWEAESGSTSGSGSLAALGSRDQIRVLELPSGRTVYGGAGRFPRLSPDGTQLAFVLNERLFIRSLASETEREPLRKTRVMGVGGWSPDGRFLAAGAWTRRFAFEKRAIILDTTTGLCAQAGTLGDGDWGLKAGWVSTKLLAP